MKTWSIPDNFEKGCLKFCRTAKDSEKIPW